MARTPKRKASANMSSAAPNGNGQDISEAPPKKQKTEPTATSTRPRRSLPNSSDSAAVIKSTAENTATQTKRPVQNLPQKKAAGRPRKLRPEVARASTGKEDVDHQPADPTPERKAGKKSNNGVDATTNVSPLQDEEQAINGDEATQNSVSVAVSSTKKKNKKTKAKANTGAKVLRESEEEADGDCRQFWLMKAEPESRIEKGKDVKFSIDDLKDATTPEPWDGVRNLEARNNMRAMTKGDLAFFYHSNCKVPGIVGIMEIVQEHTVDESAFDPSHPYYDEKSSRETPKWQVVHVAFRQKFPEIIKLKELQKFSKERGQLEDMQTLKRTRLSVSKVSKKEWDFIMTLVADEDMDADETTTTTTQRQPKEIADANDSEAVGKTDSKGDQAEAVKGSVEGVKSDAIAST